MTETRSHTPVGAVAPQVDADSAPFWHELREGRLTVPSCSQGHRFFPPMPGCPVCGDETIEFVAASGRARLYSWATVAIALHPAFEADTPYTVVVADLDEGGRLMGRLLDPPDALAAGAALRLEPYSVDGGPPLPGFRVAQD